MNYKFLFIGLCLGFLLMTKTVYAQVAPGQVGRTIDPPAVSHDVGADQNVYKDNNLSVNTTKILLVISSFFITTGLSFLEFDSIIKINMGKYFFKFINKIL